MKKGEEREGGREAYADLIRMGGCVHIPWYEYCVPAWTRLDVVTYSAGMKHPQGTENYTTA